MILIPEQITELRKNAETLWWLMSAADYKAWEEKERTEESRIKFEKHVSEALGNKY